MLLPVDETIVTSALMNGIVVKNNDGVWIEVVNTIIVLIYIKEVKQFFFGFSLTGKDTDAMNVALDDYNITWKLLHD